MRKTKGIIFVALFTLIERDVNKLDKHIISLREGQHMLSITQ